MEFPKTRDYVYHKCVERVDERRKAQGKKMIDLCPDDKSLVSHFFKCHTTRNNPYLITKRLLNVNNEEQGVYGAVPILGFKDEFEVLWGNDEEFSTNSYDIFKSIVMDIFNSKSKEDYKKEDLDIIDTIETVLCDDITFAKYSTFFHLKEKYQVSTIKYFGILESSISITSMSQYFEDALRYLYHKDDFGKSFEKSFYKFTRKYKNYKYFDKRLYEEYVIPKLIPLFKKFMPTSASLGLRVKRLIEDDISKMIEQIPALHTSKESSSTFMFNRKIINASSEYIVKLEEIAKQYNTEYIRQ